MKRTIGSLIGVAALLLPLASCSLFQQMQYNLSVTVEPGVTGTPAAGVQALDELTEIDYSYAPANALHTVAVWIDGGMQAAAGKVTIYKDIALAAKLIDIRGAWNVTSTDANNVSISFTVTFAGPDLLGGTFSDSRNNYSGTWTGPSNKLTFKYANWEAYEYSGTIYGMSGTYKNGSATGTWKASRVQ